MVEEHHREPALRGAARLTYKVIAAQSLNQGWPDYGA